MRYEEKYSRAGEACGFHTRYRRLQTHTFRICNTNCLSKQIAVGGYRLERVSNFLSLGSIINDDNSISEEVTHGIKKGNRAYCVHEGLAIPELFSKYIKRKISVAMIRVVVTYACKSWTLHET